VDLADATRGAGALQDRLPDAQAPGQSHGGPGSGKEIGGQIGAIAGQHARFACKDSVAVQAELGTLNLGW
jgi:hypothetical protein